MGGDTSVIVIGAAVGIGAELVSPDAYTAWIDGTIKPNLPPGVQLADPEFIDLALTVEPG
jgi:hypothetical protein